MCFSPLNKLKVLLTSPVKVNCKMGFSVLINSMNLCPSYSDDLRPRAHTGYPETTNASDNNKRS